MGGRSCFIPSGAFVDTLMAISQMALNVILASLQAFDGLRTASISLQIINLSMQVDQARRVVSGAPGLATVMELLLNDN